MVNITSTIYIRDSKLLRHILISVKFHFIKVSLMKGIFSTNYKNTVISRFYKSGDPQQVTYYRPICLISNKGKIGNFPGK